MGAQRGAVQSYGVLNFIYSHCHSRVKACSRARPIGQTVHSSSNCPSMFLRRRSCQNQHGSGRTVFSVDSNPSLSEGENTEAEKTEFIYALPIGRTMRKAKLSTGETPQTGNSADQGYVSFLIYKSISNCDIIIVTSSSTIQSHLAHTSDALYVIAILQSTTLYTLRLQC